MLSTWTSLKLCPLVNNKVYCCTALTVFMAHIVYCIAYQFDRLPHNAAF